eukprot:scaffold98317_cov40-Cyclotella_meneghiniana.AAC.3
MKIPWHTSASIPHRLINKIDIVRTSIADRLQGMTFGRYPTVHSQIIVGGIVVLCGDDGPYFVYGLLIFS